MSAEPWLRDVAATPSLVAKLVVAGLLSLAVGAIVPRTVSSSGSIPPAARAMRAAASRRSCCASARTRGYKG